MAAKGIHIFWNVAGVWLIAAATAFFIALHAGARLVWPPDAVFRISLYPIYWIFAGLTLVGALVCLFSQSARLKASLTLGLTSTALVYALGAQRRDPQGDFSAYLANAASAFDLAPATTFWLAKLACFVFVIGSGATLWFEIRPAAYDRQNPLPEYRKVSCRHCGGKIKFDARNAGQNIPCPHCETVIRLQESGILKMTCVLCHGHLEFPSHALGQKIPCPHCAKTITLLNPG